MKKKLKKWFKAGLWKEIAIMSWFHVAVDRCLRHIHRLARWLLKKIDLIKSENLRIWTTWMVKTLTFYHKIDEED